MHRPLLRVALAVLAVTAPACNREEATKEATEEKAKTSAGEATKAEAGGCDAAHGQAIEQELLAQCAVMHKVLEIDAPSVPWKEMPSPAPAGALRIDVTLKGVMLDGWGEPIAFEELGHGRFAEEHDRMLEMAAANGRPSPEGWVLAIDRKTTRLHVAKVLQALDGAGMRQGHLRLGTDSPGPLPVPRDPKLLAEIAAKVTEANPAGKALLFAKELEKVVTGCPPAKEAFEVAATHAFDERCAQLARTLSQGLVRCGCAKETEILTLMHGLSVGLQPTVRLGTSVPVTLDSAAEPLPGGVWSEVVANLDETRLDRLWVSPG